LRFPIDASQWRLQLANCKRGTEGAGLVMDERTVAASWNQPLDELFAALKTSETGLSTAEVQVRRATFGPNRVVEVHGQRPLRAFLRKFRNPLVIVLLGAAALAALTQDPASFFIITSIVFLSVLIDFVQERRAEQAITRLRERVALRVTAVREGKQQDLPAADLVPGDLVCLCAGDLVPADSRLIASKDLYVNEALLTGEPYPAEKSETATDAAGERAVPRNAVFMGTSVVSGTARALVVRTGQSTQLGSIASSLQKEPPPTAFALGIRDFGVFILRFTVLLVLFVLLVNLFFQRPALDSFLFALALAVGLTPELLPMVVSVTLAHGAIRLSREQVIVKRLSAIHDLGSMDVLCSDKTGTLTEAHIRLVRELNIAGADSKSVLRWAHVNAAFETGLKSPLDEAIMERESIDRSDWRKIDEVPFDFERRRVSVLAEHDGHRYLVVKGAPEDVLKFSSHYATAAGEAPAGLDPAAIELAKATLEQLSSEGFRVLGVAWREVESDREHASIADEAELTFEGFAAFLDPPKESSRPALESLNRLGVAVKIVTGDNEKVTRHVCRELGMEVTGAISGPDLETLSDEALMAQLADTNLFCRVNPTQKARIIRALRRRGHVVGYLGDGINDAPSLHAADVGLSVEGAVDVAKEAASMILLRHDLNVLVEGVREGRRTFVNIMKYIMMGTSSNFGNMFSMAGGVLFLPFLPMLPVQILLNNLLYDVSEIAIPLDNVDERAIERPCHWDMWFVRDFMIVLGPVSSLFDFITFGVLLWIFQANEALFHTGWFVESLATQVLVIFIIRTRGSPLRSVPHPLLTATSLAVVVIAVALPFTPIGTWLGFVPLPAGFLVALAAMTATYLVVVEYVKAWFYNRHRFVR
jgi:Mg2+-importing ATPase